MNWTTLIGTAQILRQDQILGNDTLIKEDEATLLCPHDGSSTQLLAVPGQG